MHNVATCHAYMCGELLCLRKCSQFTCHGQKWQPLLQQKLLAQSIRSFQTCPPPSLSAEGTACAQHTNSSSQTHNSGNNRNLSSTRSSHDWTDFASAPAQPAAGTPTLNSPSLLDTGGGWGTGDPFAVCEKPSKPGGAGAGASPQGSQQGGVASLLSDGESKSIHTAATHVQHHASAKSADEVSQGGRGLGWGVSTIDMERQCCLKIAEDCCTPPQACTFALLICNNGLMSVIPGEHGDGILTTDGGSSRIWNGNRL
eukprot:1153545-Pelagomonas_calceolata.AAC.3